MLIPVFNVVSGYPAGVGFLALELNRFPGSSALQFFICRSNCIGSPARFMSFISNIRGVAKFIAGNQATKVTVAASTTAVDAFRKHIKDFWIPVLKSNAAKAGTNVVAVQYRMIGYWRKMRNIVYASILAPGVYEGFRFFQRFKEIRANVTDGYVGYGLRFRDLISKFIVIDDMWYFWYLYYGLTMVAGFMVFYVIVRFLVWLWRFVKFQRTVIHSLIAVSNDEVINDYRQEEADNAARDLLKIVSNPIFQGYINKLVIDLVVKHGGSAKAVDRNISETIEDLLANKRFAKSFDDRVEEYLSKPATIKKLDGILAVQPAMNKAIHGYTDLAIRGLRSSTIKNK
jgi:hypothetical protein